VKVQLHVPVVYPRGALAERLVAPQADMDAAQKRPLLLYRVEHRFIDCPIRRLVAVPTEFEYFYSGCVLQAA
jgi:hypothetical protein